MTKNTPIILDRLAAALGRHGVKLKRQQLLDVAASAYGLRDAGVFSAKDADGSLDVPKAEYLGADENGLALLRDPRADALFAMEIKNPKARAGRWCISPYGEILDIAAIPAEGELPQAEIQIHTAMISHRHGSDFYTSFTPDGLDAEIAGFCDQYWSEAREYDDSLPETTEGMTDEEIATAYFSAVTDEYIDRGTDRLMVPAAVARSMTTPTGDAWVMTAVGDDEEEPQLWWNQDDGWGDLASATVYPDRNGTLPNIGMEEGSVRWQRLPQSYVRKAAGKPETSVQPEAEWERMPSTEWSAKIGSIVCIGKIDAAKDVTFVIHNVERLPDSEHNGGYRIRTILQTGGKYDREAAEKWAQEVTAEIAEAGGEILVADGYARIIFQGDAHASEAPTPEDWINAMRDLIQPVAGRERIMAQFVPEAWVNDHAIAIDAEGDTEIDVTFEMLLIGRDAAMSLSSADTDHLQEAIRSPDWIRRWNGPFTIRVHEAVEETGLYDF